MNTTKEKNPKLYQQWFGVFATMLLIAVAVTEWAHKFVDAKNADLASSSVILFPLAGMGVYGLCMNYFPGGWYNEIIRGREATVWNIVFITIYLITMAYDYLKM